MSKWDGNEAGFRKWLDERIQSLQCKPAQTTTVSAHKFDPDIARFERWKRERQWIYGWYEINEHRPAHITTTPPPDWIDLVETRPLNDIASRNTERVAAILLDRHTEQMSPVVSRPVPVTDPMPKITTPLVPDQAEYHLASISLFENMKNAVRDFYVKNKSMPSKIFLSRFNMAVARTQGIIQEADLNGKPVLFFVYANLFLVPAQEYLLLSDQIIIVCQ